ncbi:MAG TPA: hypothetical protein VK667_07825, partial [Ktedonobacteraceae bacterium]|nr:hypothetical protein [Ktedonobacteraceae bacterium]
ILPSIVFLDFSRLASHGRSLNKIPPFEFTENAAGCPCPFRHGEECGVPLSVAWVRDTVDILSSAPFLLTGR